MVHWLDAEMDTRYSPAGSIVTLRPDALIGALKIDTEPSVIKIDVVASWKKSGACAIPVELASHMSATRAECGRFRTTVGLQSVRLNALAPPPVAED